MYRLSIMQIIYCLHLIINKCNGFDSTNCAYEEQNYPIGEKHPKKLVDVKQSSNASQHGFTTELFQRLIMGNENLTKEEIPLKRRWQLLYSSNLLEGDILLNSRRKLKKLFEPRLFGTTRPLGMPWPDAKVPFVFNEEFGTHDQLKIILAMKEIHDHTCVRFVQRRNETNFVKFYKSDGCASHVGFQHNEQGISLSDDCLKSHVIILHELMHALGFWHEHSRYDRDNYITIIWKNIPETARCNFRKFEEPQRARSVEYDYNSVLHIPLSGFSVNASRPTYKLKYPLYFRTPPTGLSTNDVLRIIEHYNCNGRLWQSYQEILFAISTPAVTDYKLESNGEDLPFKGRMAVNFDTDYTTITSSVQADLMKFHRKSSTQSSYGSPYSNSVTIISHKSIIYEIMTKMLITLHILYL